MITREGFYAAFESLKRHVELLRSVEDFLHTDLGSSPVGEMVDEAYNIFCHLVFGKDEIDESIFDAVHNDELYFNFVDDINNIDEGPVRTCKLPYDKYYEFFVERRLEDDWFV